MSAIRQQRIIAARSGTESTANLNLHHQLGRSVLAYPLRRGTSHVLVTAPRFAMVDPEHLPAFAASGPYVARPSERHHLTLLCMSRTRGEIH